jgi:autotransporter-associated beta strand protein
MLTIGDYPLTVTSGSGYGFLVTGTTVLNGGISAFSNAFLPYFGVSADPNASLFALSGLVTGSGALNKLGVGVLTLEGSNNYSGGTNIVAGTVLLNTGSATLGTGKVVLYSTGTLAIISSSNVLLATASN